MRIAIIDLGTNSVRFDLYEVDHKQTIKRLHRERLMVRLGDGLFNGTHRLSPQAIQRTADAFKHFAEIINSSGVDRVHAFATSALREARNSAVLTQRVKREAKITIKVISGAEEARLIARGILEHESLPKGFFALLDIGGGSTEISLCKGTRVLWAQSFPLGVARLAQRFAVGSEQAMRNHIRQTLGRILARHPRTDVVIGSSGTIRAVAKVFRRETGKKQIASMLLSRFVANLEGMTSKEVLHFSSVEPKRAEVFVPGAVLLDEILQLLSSKRLVASDFSLRDGLISEVVARGASKASQKRAVICRLGSALSAKPTQIEEACESLFIALRTLHKLPRKYLPVLVGCAVLLDGATRIAGAQGRAIMRGLSELLTRSAVSPNDLKLIRAVSSYINPNRTKSRKALREAPKRLRKPIRTIALLVRMAIVLATAPTPLKAIRTVRSRAGNCSIQLAAPEIVSLRLDQLRGEFEEVTKHTLLVESRSTIYRR